ncbi:carnitine dehydratase [Pigmentiphaga sp. NML080357]|uniref:CaiB/BaiF CoA transferase family protein n=1 Tax=Pigmentiphaga sp. NML080357 TaxID=2008675 RepID=UPI000B41E038|nr:CaiB/BaiF CoA-transferase family protein [Pigmentiphaga sp. NML080357]OVZ64924.1 carnitine dehydratase [Pigmentiphaga sp. NML080357]
MGAQAAGPLAGLRILDLTRLLPGPMATRRLADLGAEVTKIEDPAGDPARGMGPARGGTSEVFLAVNRNKRYATLDLKTSKGRDTLLAMAQDADALVESFRPGTLARLGLGWNALHAANPRLVLCSITGYGQSGPLARRAGHDINYLALSGVLHQNAVADGLPALPGLPVSDALGAQAAATAILAALIEAGRTGAGRHVDVALADAAFAHHVLALAEVNVHGRAGEPGRGLLTGGAPCYAVYRCADGRSLAVGALEFKFWAALCEALQRPDLVPCHWSRGLAPGAEESARVREELERVFRGKSRDEWNALLESVDCCVTPVLSMEEAMAHPYFAIRGEIAGSCAA